MSKYSHIRVSRGYNRKDLMEAMNITDWRLSQIERGEAPDEWEERYMDFLRPLPVVCVDGSVLRGMRYDLGLTAAELGGITGYDAKKIFAIEKGYNLGCVSELCIELFAVLSDLEMNYTDDQIRANREAAKADKRCKTL